MLPVVINKVGNYDTNLYIYISHIYLHYLTMPLITSVDTYVCKNECNHLYDFADFKDCKQHEKNCNSQKTECLALRELYWELKKDILSNAECTPCIINDPIDMDYLYKTKIKEDRDWIGFFAFDENYIHAKNWVLRIAIVHCLEFEEYIEKIRARYGDKLHMIYNDEISHVQVIRIRIKSNF